MFPSSLFFHLTSFPFHANGTLRINSFKLKFVKNRRKVYFSPLNLSSLRVSFFLLLFKVSCTLKMITFWEAPDFQKTIHESIIGNVKRAVWSSANVRMERVHHKYLRRLYYCNTLYNFTEKTFWPHHVKRVCLFAATQYTVNLTLEREITDDKGASFYTDLEKMEAASFSLIQEVRSFHVTFTAFTL